MHFFDTIIPPQTKSVINTLRELSDLQFLYYPYPLLEETKEWNGIYLSGVTDIACTKLITVSMRGSKAV